MKTNHVIDDINKLQPTQTGTCVRILQPVKKTPKSDTWFVVVVSTSVKEQRLEMSARDSQWAQRARQKKREREMEQEMGRKSDNNERLSELADLVLWL